MAVLLALQSLGWDSCRLPTFDWLLLDSGTGGSMAYAMTDMGTHLYIGGHTSGNMSIIGANGVEHHYSDADVHKDLYVVKVDSALGEPVAVFLLDGDATGSSNVLMDLAPMPDGQHLGVAGYFRGTMTMPTEGGRPSITLSNPNSVDLNGFVSVMNAGSGHTVWAHHFASELSTSVYGVAADGSGNVVAVGKFCYVGTGCAGGVSKFAAADGAEEWSKSWNVSFWGVKVSVSGDVYAAGGHTGTIDVGGDATPQTSANGGEAGSTLVLRLTAQGVPAWAFSFGEGVAGTVKSVRLGCALGGVAPSVPTHPEGEVGSLGAQPLPRASCLHRRRFHHL